MVKRIKVAHNKGEKVMLIPPIFIWGPLGPPLNSSQPLLGCPKLLGRYNSVVVVSP